MKRFPHAATILAPVALLALAGCDQQQGAAHTPPNDTTAGDVSREMNQAAEATGEFMENQYAALKAEIDQGVERVNEQIVALRAKASEATGDTKTAIDNAIASLEEQRDALMDNLEDASDATGDAWRDVKDGLSDAWRNLKDAADDAVDRFDGE